MADARSRTLSDAITLVKMTVQSSDDAEDNPVSRFLDSVEGEISLFRSVMRARPVGIHRHFHVLTIRNAIYQDTGRLVSIDDIWAKLRCCYDLDNLESIEMDGYDPPGQSGSPAAPIRSPSPSENLSMHPFFRQEFLLPSEESFDSLISSRRMRATASLPSSSPAPSPSYYGRSGGSRTGKRGRSKLKNMAGLVGGDSDSSALTQESGDESIIPTPRESLAGGTDGGTDYAEDEDAYEREQSPAPSIASKQPRKTAKSTRRGSAGSRARGASAAASRGTKRKKK
ncbi:hypothetical protein AcV7_009719 [Taiwanofungus camphoratus]|nr:hypothetical protein AcW2_007422 [Antrodia cinnamomea]KAI0947249.1 hypothetical protein AcV7_009719 [Antrodia cinnamomea]